MFEVETCLNNTQLPYLYPDKKQPRSESLAIAHKSMENKCIKQAVEVSYLASNKNAVLLGLYKLLF